MKRTYDATADSPDKAISKRARIEEENKEELCIFFMDDLLKPILSFLDMSNARVFSSVIALSSASADLRKWVLPRVNRLPGRLSASFPIWRNFTGLQQISLNVTDELVKNVASFHFPVLRRLGLVFESCNVRLPPAFIEAHSPSVTSLRLHSLDSPYTHRQPTCLYPTAKDMFGPYTSLTRLVKLSFTGYSHHHGSFHQHYYLQRESSPEKEGINLLTSLQAVHVTLDKNVHPSMDAMCIDMARLPLLTTLYVKFDARQVFALEISRLTNLTALALDVETQVYFQNHPVLSLPLLRQLRLIDPVQHAISILTNLEVLYLDDSRYLDAPTMDGIFMFPKLRQLAITACPHEDHLRKATQLKRLHFLSWARCAGIGKLTTAQESLAAFIRSANLDIECTFEERYLEQEVSTRDHRFPSCITKYYLPHRIDDF